MTVTGSVKQRSTAKVLVAESDPLFGRIIKTKLESWGYQPVLEHNGLGALQWYKADTYRVVVVSSNLAGMEGADLIRQIRDLPRPYYTYILFTAPAGDKNAMLEGLSAGADEFMGKPLNGVELGLRLKNAERLMALDDQLFQGGGLNLATGVLNRSAFQQFFDTILAQCIRSKTSGTLMFATIDNMQTVFRAHGFDATTQLQRQAVDILVPALRQSDLFAHLKDGEFCLMLQETGAEGCRVLAERLGNCLRTLEADCDGTLVPGKMSLSMATYPQGNLNASDFLDHATRTPLNQD